MSIITTGRHDAIYVGESRGHRRYLRQLISKHFNIPQNRIRFHECAQSEVDTEIARGHFARMRVIRWQDIQNLEL